MRLSLYCPSLSNSKNWIVVKRHTLPQPIQKVQLSKRKVALIRFWDFLLACNLSQPNTLTRSIYRTYPQSNTSSSQMLDKQEEKVISQRYMPFTHLRILLKVKLKFKISSNRDSSSSRRVTSSLTLPCKEHWMLVLRPKDTALSINFFVQFNILSNMQPTLVNRTIAILIQQMRSAFSLCTKDSYFLMALFCYCRTDKESKGSL